MKCIEAKTVMCEIKECVECGFSMSVPSTVETGEVVDCNDCGKEYETIAVGPLKLVAAPEVEEDWGE